VRTPEQRQELWDALFLEHVKKHAVFSTHNTVTEARAWANAIVGQLELQEAEGEREGG